MEHVVVRRRQAEVGLGVVRPGDVPGPGLRLRHELALHLLQDLVGGAESRLDAAHGGAALEPCTTTNKQTDISS